MKVTQVAYIKPSLNPQYDEEIIVPEDETWKSISDQLEAVLDDHFVREGWSGELTIQVRFKELKTQELTKLLREMEE